MAMNIVVKKIFKEEKVQEKTIEQKATELLEQKLFACDGKIELAGNRGELPDKFNEFMGIPHGNAYCLSALLYFVWQVKNELEIDFSLPKIPSTQRFIESVDKSLFIDKPKRFSLALFQSTLNKSLGHAVYVCAEHDENGDFKTFEFNSNQKGSRDGTNVGMFLKRNINTNKNLKLICFIDLEKAIKISQ